MIPTYQNNTSKILLKHQLVHPAIHNQSNVKIRLNNIIHHHIVIHLCIITHLNIIIHRRGHYQVKQIKFLDLFAHLYHLANIDCL